MVRGARVSASYKIEAHGSVWSMAYYTPGIGKIVPRNLNNLNNKRLTTSEWPTKILTTLS